MSKTARLTVGLLLIIILIGAGFGVIHLGIYGWALFVIFPVFLGGIVAGVFQQADAGRAARLGAVTVAAALLSLLLVRVEGLICIAMVLPLATLLGAFGGWLAFKLGSSRLENPGIAMLVLLPLASLTWDARAKPAVFEVRSSIEIAAAPEQVWKHVVTFSDLPEPQEWYFRAGLAYPQRARIDGSGVGAIRYCEFSTGSFVEPIEVWNEPRLLRFKVTRSPAPMREWSPYGQVVPRHLTGYMVSRRGQFQLTRLAHNRTLLEGTTWYQHGLWPAEYWRWWSDAIVHRIHLRVLTHIRTLSEKEALQIPGRAFGRPEALD